MDERDHLGLVDTPTLVIVGAHDPSTPPDRGKYIAERVPGARLVSLDCAHLSNVECEDAFNAALFGFMTGARA